MQFLGVGALGKQFVELLPIALVGGREVAASVHRRHGRNNGRQDGAGLVLGLGAKLRGGARNGAGGGSRLRAQSLRTLGDSRGRLRVGGLIGELARRVDGLRGKVLGLVEEGYLLVVSFYTDVHIV